MSCLFFFIFVCLAMHACNARHLGVVMDDNDVSNKKHLFSTKVVGSVKRPNKEQPTETSLKSIVFRERKGREERSKTAVGVSASAKELDDRCGFFSDYSRPRTRPPSHN
ncbi:hypothetical protein ERO13_A07G041250v2 [Gossypium hirsutum]|nr:hypothetical protein ERO13_A07G041250v2 [Gossypium hirsutum]